MATEATKWVSRKVWAWNEIRPIGQAPLVQASVFFPVVGYLLLLNTQVISFAELDPQFQIWDHGAPWRLVLLYYGLCFLAAGTAIFSFRCPTAIKQWPTMQGYVGHLLPMVMLAPHRRDDALKLLLDSMDYDEGIGRPVSEDMKVIRPVLESGGNGNVDTIRMAVELGLQNEWSTFNGERPWSRLVCVAAFGLGFVILLLPTVQTFVEVTAWIAKEL